MYRFSLLCVALLAVATQAQAQTKADGMFDELSRDFGSVPRGQLLTHYFRIVNNTDKPVQIASVSVSCHCVDARALQRVLQPGQETAIEAKMDTNRFTNSRTVTIYVLFAQPRQEVRLWVQANSREDVTFTPDNLAFGQVKRGTKAESKITISFLGGQTKILEMKSDSNYVIPSLKELQRGNGETAYEITAKLREDTPAGKWFTDVWLKTNNNGMQRLRVPVTVEVEAPLSVNPGTVSLGQVKAGTESDRKVIIRGVRPFRIVGITGTDNQVQVRTTSNESKSVHVLTVTLNPMEAGTIFRPITVQTDLKTNGDVTFNASAEVVP
jgi:Protein of unknown function (DUF1573)